MAKVTPMDLLRMTPKSNCGECGYESCYQFALNASRGMAEIDLCPYFGGQGESESPQSAQKNAAAYRRIVKRTSGEESAGAVYGNVSNASTVYGQEVFHARQGHGYAAEQAEHLRDVLSGKDAALVGSDLSKDGADRLVNGTYIQTKYCISGSECVSKCFHDGKFRYLNADGTPMKIEVPSDQYQEALKAMENRIKNGEIPGVKDVAEAKNIIKKGHFTYEQAKNIAKAGTVESITFDAVNGAVVAGSSFGITTALTFATSLWNGEPYDIALKTATYSGLKVGGTTFITAILAGQLTKAGLNSALVGSSEALVRMIGPKGSQLIVNALRSGKNIYGGAAMKSAAKMLRNNVITGVASVVVLSSVDVVNIFRSRISGKQLFKNVAETTASVAGGTAGWMGGAATGAAIGSAVPIVGTAIGGFVGGVLGAFAGGAVSGKVANKALSVFIEDDADEMVGIIEQQFGVLAEDYLLSQAEAERVADRLQGMLTGGTLKDMFASENRKGFANRLLEPIVESVAKDRKKVKLPSAEELQKSLVGLLEELSEDGKGNESPAPIQQKSLVIEKTKPGANYLLQMSRLYLYAAKRGNPYEMIYDFSSGKNNERLRNAADTFGPGSYRLNISDVYAQYDTTFWDSGKEGFLFCKDGFYYDRCSDKGHVLYKDVKSVKHYRPYKSKDSDRGLVIELRDGRTRRIELAALTVSALLAYIEEMSFVTGSAERKIKLPETEEFIMSARGVLSAFAQCDGPVTAAAQKVIDKYTGAMKELSSLSASAREKIKELENERYFSYRIEDVADEIPPEQLAILRHMITEVLLTKEEVSDKQLEEFEEFLKYYGKRISKA